VITGATGPLTGGASRSGTPAGTSSERIIPPTANDVTISSSAAGIGARWDTFQSRPRQRRKEAVRAAKHVGSARRPAAHLRVQIRNARPVSLLCHESRGSGRGFSFLRTENRELITVFHAMLRSIYQPRTLGACRTAAGKLCSNR